MSLKTNIKRMGVIIKFAWKEKKYTKGIEKKTINLLMKFIKCVNLFAKKFAFEIIQRV